jgi:hypothetical protein
MSATTIFTPKMRVLVENEAASMRAAKSAEARRVGRAIRCLLVSYDRLLAGSKVSTGYVMGQDGVLHEYSLSYPQSYESREVNGPTSP